MLLLLEYLRRLYWEKKKYPIPNVDPTRTISLKKEKGLRRLLAKLKLPNLICAKKIKHYHFCEKEVAMYHMNFVRKDKMRSKLSNTSTTNREFLEKIERNVNSWVPGMEFVFPGKGSYYFEKVENEFNTFGNSN